MQLTDINFLQNIAEKKHSRYGEVHRYIQFRDMSFYNYQLTFERLVAERCIMTGCRVSLRDVPIHEDIALHTHFARIIGISQYSIYRTTIAKDFLELIDQVGFDEFIRNERYTETSYYRTSMERLEAQSPKQIPQVRNKRISNRMKKFAMLYINMKKAKGLVNDGIFPSASSGRLQYYDFPWAIDYFGYVKRMDGAHRRAIANHLGLDSIPTLVFAIKDADEEILSSSCEYLQENFSWFMEILDSLHCCLGNRIANTNTA